MQQEGSSILPGSPRVPPGRLRPVTVVLVAGAGVVLGAGDQYMGSLFVPVATAFSLMSAPWLLLPFCFGCSQVRSRSGALIGLAATLGALFGYWAMTLSPIEGVHISQFPQDVFALIYTNARWLIAGLITGPVYGLLGQRWRTRRWWLSAVLAAGPVLLEPVTRVLNLEYGPPLAYVVEVTAGALVAAYFAVVAVRSAGRMMPSH